MKNKEKPSKEDIYKRKLTLDEKKNIIKGYIKMGKPSKEWKKFYNTFLKERTMGERIDFLIAWSLGGRSYCLNNFNVEDSNEARNTLQNHFRKLLTQQRQEILEEALEMMKRLKLEFDVVVCDCGEAWKETDGAGLVKEYIKELKLKKEK